MKGAYMMLRGNQVFIEKIHTVECSVFDTFYGAYNGEIPVKIKSRCLEKALEFCEKRGQLRRTHSSLASMLFFFDHKFYKDVLNSDLDLLDLIYAAARLGIHNLLRLLLVDVVNKTTPEQLEKFFKLGPNRCYSSIDNPLIGCPPCPTLSIREQEFVKCHHEEILNADFKTLPPLHKRYWVYAHLFIKCLAAAADEESEQEKSKVPKNDHDVGEPGPRKRAYIMLHGKPVFIKKLHSVESRCFMTCLDTEYDGEIPFKIESRYLEKALEFCEERARFRKKYRSPASMVTFFDRKFLKDVRQSKIDLLDLIHAAGMLGIHNLVDLLFDDVFSIIWSKKPIDVKDIFKVRYHSNNFRCCKLIRELLKFAPPCPTLSIEQLRDVRFYPSVILNKSPHELKTLTEPERRYWVYAHLVIKSNTALFFEVHEDAAEESWVYPHLVIKSNTALSFEVHEDAAEDDEEEEEESKVHNCLGFQQERKMWMYIMLNKRRVFIKEKHTVESRCFKACYDTSFVGKIPIIIEGRCLKKALEFCERRAVLRMNHSSPASLDDFDRDFLKGVQKSGPNLIDLFHAAGRLGINNLVSLLFEDVVHILCDKSPEQVEMIFKVRYNGDYLFCSLINELLDFAPPCPNLYIREQEDVKGHREKILKVSPADFKKQSPTHKRYWVYAHLVIKCNHAMFIAIHEDAAEDDVGGPGPRGVAWKTKKTTR